MNFGKLDRQIKIEVYTSARTDSGAFVKTWSSLGFFWAKVDYKTGGEKYEANQEQSFAVVNFIIRKCDSVAANEQMRILYNNEYFDIMYVNELERNKYQQLEAKRKTVYQEQ